MINLFGTVQASQPSLIFPQSLTERYRPSSIDSFIGLEKPKKLAAKLAANPFPSPERGEIVAVELNIQLANRLHSEFPLTQVISGDFLEQIPGEPSLGMFDVILMNPPFANGADIKHITHAIKFLKPGGRLVAICANGPRQAEQLQGLADTWEVLPADTFKDEGTTVNTALLTLTLPAPAPIEAPAQTFTLEPTGPAQPMQLSLF